MDSSGYGAHRATPGGAHRGAAHRGLSLFAREQAPTDMRGRSDRKAASRIDRRCSRRRRECSTSRPGGPRPPLWKAPRRPGCMQSPKDKCNSARRRRFARRRWRTDTTRRPCRPRAGQRTGASPRPRPTFLTASRTPARRRAAGLARFDRRGTSRAPGSGKPCRRPNPMRTTSKRGRLTSSAFVPSNVGSLSSASGPQGVPIAPAPGPEAAHASTTDRDWSACPPKDSTSDWQPARRTMAPATPECA